MKTVLDSLKGKLIVSCQALENEPLHSPFIMSRMALAAAQVVWHYTLIRSRQRPGCFTAFSKSHWMGAALFAGVALGFALR